MCINVDFIGEVCGADLADYIPDLAGDLPYVVFNQTLDLSNICGGGSGSGSHASSVSVYKHRLPAFNATAIQAEVALKKGMNMSDKKHFLASKPTKPFAHRQASRPSSVRANVPQWAQL